MFTRRGVLLASIAAGVSMPNRNALAKASQPSTPVNFDVPAGACDCHTHIHGDPEKFPFFAGRVYTPEPASPEEMSALHKALHIERVVIVTPSVYGTDNSATLFGMKARGPTARGVAVIDDKTPEADLDAMGQAGIRGIRLNLATGGVNDPTVGRPRFQAAVERVKARGWHVQLFTSLAMISAIKDLVAASPVPVVFDHFGGAQAELGVAQPGFSDLVELVKSGKAYVKISGAYRASKLGPDYSDVVPLAQALIAANSDRIVWGTDWPHPNSVTPAGRKPTELTPLYQIDDGRLLNQLPVWAPDAAIRKQDPHRKSGAALRVLSAGSRRCPLALPQRFRTMGAQPVGGLAQAAERKQVETGDRRRRLSGRRLQAAHDVIRPGIREQPAKTADLAAQRADRIADAATKRKFGQRGGARRTREPDNDGKAHAAPIELGDPAQDRRAFEAELRHDIDADSRLLSPVPPCFEPAEGRIHPEIRVAFGMAGHADPRDAARLDHAAAADIEA